MRAGSRDPSPALSTFGDSLVWGQESFEDRVQSQPGPCSGVGWGWPADLSRERSFQVSLGSGSE